VKALASRAEVVARARRFFASRGFVEVETPAIVPCPGLDVHLDAFAVTPAEEPGAAPRYLATSPEYQMKRLLADGHARIFQICRAYRAGELGARHNPEFSILELYRAGADVEAVMRDTEQLVAHVTGGAIALGDRVVSTLPPFERLPFVEAYRRFAGLDPDETLRLASDDEDTLFRTLVGVVEPGLAALDHAVFVTDFPAAQASLARKKAADPRLAERFELYVAGVELCNGFGELTDPVEQRARFDEDRAVRSAMGKVAYPIDERFMEALERGLPPCAGNAIGLDRLVALACGGADIAPVMAFTADEL
jgi:elongation factor P--(R)-beta-lysine ligase